MNILDILNLLILFTNCLIVNKEKNNIAQAFKKIGLIDGIISFIDETKIHITILSSILSLILTIIQNDFDVLDYEQV